MRGAITAVLEEMTKADCARRRVGAVIMNEDGEIVGRGHNGLLQGSCLDGQCPRGKLSYAQQPKDVGYAESGCYAIHAEMMALQDAGHLADGATMFVSETPCPSCQDALYAYQIAEVEVLNFNHPAFTGKFVPPV